MNYIKTPRLLSVLELYKTQIYQVPKERMGEYLILLTHEFGSIDLCADDNPSFPRPVVQLDMGYSKLGLVYNMNARLLIKLGDVSWSFSLSDNKVQSYIEGPGGPDFDYLLKLVKEKSDSVKSTRFLEQFEVEINAGEVWYYTLEELYDFLDIKGIKFEDDSPIKSLAYDRNHSVRGFYVGTKMMKALDGLYYQFHRNRGVVFVNKYEVEDFSS